MGRCVLSSPQGRCLEVSRLCPLPPYLTHTLTKHACCVFDSDSPCSFLQIEQAKLSNLDTSWGAALAAATQMGAVDVEYKLQALIGVQLPQTTPVGQPGGTGGLAAAAAAVSSAAAAAARASAAAALAGGATSDTVAALTQNFKPDLALKQELHDLKVKKRQRLALLTIPVPSPRDAAFAAAAAASESAGAVGGGDDSSFGAGAGEDENAAAINTRSYGVRQFGIPDPSCGGVPDGCVAIR